MEYELEQIEKAITDLKERDDIEADTEYMLRKFRNAKIDEIVVLCTNHKFELARECANRFNNFYIKQDAEKAIQDLLYHINDYEKMLTGEYYEYEELEKLVRKKSKPSSRKLKNAPKRKKKRR